ncbi:MAG: DUF4416 family protein [Candidatus Omnitrophica bacterium]|nr:DUF4416 family protein [Candidatus Omnitrophota bacterium]MBU4479082.1 DUF4416 family protein [Candidatus Omnitrophota bacterium]MCG2703003.1 DUF4416 family protein [Candidatus Omnitrophota bacterium]
MGKPTKHEPVKLVIGLIGKAELFNVAEKLLCRRFGALDFESRIIDFTFTDYYEAKMGSGLKRKFLSFQRKIIPDRLPRIKLYTNALEKKYFSLKGKRFLNIDPGYLTLSKLVLATTKDHQHRLYLGKGIFAEITLRFRDKTFRKWEWTYPDYCTEEYIAIFNHIRNTFLRPGKGKSDE